ncbi:BTB/POZ domain-containing protein 6-like [Paramacrobiotus metropolitanus]|uniref:BTB/POZ domain-containing protein 6-like n=1 Tax=Paramacrobiotus metropolitanus TaxID=2943436 RepID=UPI0024462D79|nr:BTB/POZ domain-containing protein 6-like [Paramacrobiotus metropolitanus]
MSENPSLPAQSSAWRSTLSGMVDLLQHIMASGEMSDVQFAVGRQHGEPKIFTAHKLILSMGSDVFYAMFYGDLAAIGDRPVDIPEIVPDAFANMLKFLYTRSLGELTPENVLETIYCADKYNLPFLLELCLQFVNTQLKPANCLIFLEKAKHSLLDCAAGLVERCLALIDTHSQDVLKSERFSSIEQDTLEMIVQRNNLTAEENVIYTAVEKWSVNACVRGNLEPSPINRRGVLGSALFCVRFPLLTDAQMASGPVKSGLLLDAELRDIYQFSEFTYSDNEREIPFPTEARQSYHAELQEHDEVFADFGSDEEYWRPGKIMGIIEEGKNIIVTLDEGVTAKLCVRSRIVRAVDILKNGQKIKIRRSGREVSYIGRCVENEHMVSYELSNHRRLTLSHPFIELAISRAQMAAWKTSITITQSIPRT